MWVAQNLHKDEAQLHPRDEVPGDQRRGAAGVRRARRREGRRDRESDARASSTRRCWRARRATRDSCLTPPQVEAARKMYQPVMNTQTGEGDLPGPRLRQRARAGPRSARRSRSASARRCISSWCSRIRTGTTRRSTSTADIGAGGQDRERRHQRARPESQAVRGARRQADSVSRLGRSADSRGEQRAVLPERARHDGRRGQGEGQLCVCSWCRA